MSRPDQAASVVVLHELDHVVPHEMQELDAADGPSAAKPQVRRKRRRRRGVFHKRRQKYAQQACVSCRLLKVGCDDSRPCKQCVKRGKAADCCDVAIEAREETRHDCQEETESDSEERKSPEHATYDAANPDFGTEQFELNPTVPLDMDGLEAYVSRLKKAKAARSPHLTDSTFTMVAGAAHGAASTSQQTFITRSSTKTGALPSFDLTTVTTEIKTDIGTRPAQPYGTDSWTVAGDRDCHESSKQNMFPLRLCPTASLNSNVPTKDLPDTVYGHIYVQPVFRGKHF